MENMDTTGASGAPASPPSAALLAHWTLNPVQAAFLATDARFSFYVGGVGAGKTTAGALRALAWALDHPGSLGLIGAPTYPMLRDATQRAFFALLADFLGDDATYTYHKSEQRLTLPNGSEILFRSLDEPDRVRGLTLAWFWLDEAPLCGYYAWQVLKGRLRQRGYPTAGWATGTPHGRDGYAHDFEFSPRPNHTLYRAATHANAANLPPDYIADLGLSGAFYDQEVLGLFTAFEGLVYTLDAAEGGNIAEPPAAPTCAHVIGGVDWGYTNPTAAVVFGLDSDERAWQLDEYYQRRAPLDAVVIPALLDLTRRYNVDIWRCGPDEPEHIVALARALAEANLPCRALPAQNAVRPGIQTITRLLSRREDGTRGLYVSPRCVHTLAEYASYQYDSAPFAPGGNTGLPYLPEQPLKQNDHLMDACFIAGTLVETISGPKPIEQIREGEYVLTRAGYRRVLSAGMTHPAAQVMRVTFSNGRTLIGTSNHPVYVRDVGFVPLRSLCPGDIVLPANREAILRCDKLDHQTNQKRSSIAASFSGGILPHAVGRIESITCHQVNIARRGSDVYTRKSGGTLTALSLPDITSTIGTAIPSTTRWTTWSVFQATNTTPTICHSCQTKSGRNGENGSTRSEDALPIGINRLAGDNGTRNLASIHGKAVSHSSIFASSAGQCSPPEGLRLQSSVPMRANPPHGGQRGWTLRSAYASSVAQDSALTSTNQTQPAPVHVVASSFTRGEGSTAAVYNLEVEDAHEYFAQGILVHNCRYALHSTFGHGRSAKPWLNRFFGRADSP